MLSRLLLHSIPFCNLIDDGFLVNIYKPTKYHHPNKQTFHHSGDVLASLLRWSSQHLHAWKVVGCMHAPWIAMDPNFVAGILEREPFKAPIGVRPKPTMHTSAPMHVAIERSFKICYKAPRNCANFCDSPSKPKFTRLTPTEEIMGHSLCHLNKRW